MSGRTPKVALSKELRDRVARVAGLSGLTVEQWTLDAITYALLCDEAHFKEVEDWEAAKRMVGSPPFEKWSQHLANLPESTRAILRAKLTDERMRGRQDVLNRGRVRALNPKRRGR